MQDIKVARTFKTDFEKSTETSRKDIVSKLLRRIYLKMPRTFLNFDKALEMSDSDSGKCYVYLELFFFFINICVFF